jgi:putative ABC transport system substrate-binding protein
VFVLVADPVGAGLVESLAHPGGNATGFTAIDYSFGSKWLELLKELSPGVTRVGVLRDPNISVGIGLFGAIQSAATSMRVEVVPVSVGDAAAIERNIAAFARGPHDGLVVTPSPLVFAHRDTILASAIKLKLPAIYPSRPFVVSGGLAAYHPNIAEEYRLAAGYVDRILKGAKPADLPVQNPSKYETHRQSQKREGSRHRRAGRGDRPRQRGDRVEICGTGSRRLLTRSNISPPSIDALHALHSIT